MLHWESRGQKLEIGVEEYDSFGETAYTLTFPKGRRAAARLKLRG